MVMLVFCFLFSRLMKWLVRLYRLLISGVCCRVRLNRLVSGCFRFSCMLRLSR